MGRKSRVDERREAILAAFERCIVRYGIDAPLEQIADEAGVKRSLIRHYLGNRDELVAQMIARIAEAYPRQVADLLAAAAPHGVAGILDFFFAEPVITTDWDDVIVAVVCTAQGRYPQAKQHLAQMMVAITQQIAEALALLFPESSPAACYAVAYSLLCLAQTHESLLWLGLASHHTTAARASAELLLNSLVAPA